MLLDICYSEPMTDSEIFESIMKAVQQELKQAYSRKQTGSRRKAQNRDSLIRVTAQSIVGKAFYFLLIGLRTFSLKILVQRTK